MHVLLFPSWYKTAENPIRGNFFRNEALSLQRAGHRVGMLIPPSKFRTLHGLRELKQHWRQPPTAVEVSSDEGISCYQIPWWGWSGSVNPSARVDLGLEVFDRYCREQGTPDVLHGQAILYGGYLAASIGQQRQIPAVVTEHASVYLRQLIFPGQPAIIRYTLQHSSKTLVVAPSLIEALGQFVPGVVTETDVIGNIVDTDFFHPASQTAPPPPFIFIMVASLTPRKAHPLLLEAFARAFSGAPVRLRIAGSGYNGRKLDRLQQQIHQLGLEQQVEILGMISQDDLLALMQTGHAVVSSSHTETFGVTLIEAMACGKPVVATRSGGPESFVTERSGLLVPTGDAQALADAMRAMVENYADYDPAQIRAECVARFSAAAVAERLVSIYQGLLER